MRPKNSLIRGSLIAACAMAAACVGDLDGAGDHDKGVRAPAPAAVGFTPRDPGASVFSSASTPLGWESAAERRHEEWRLANGEETSSQAPPDAIGGGPEDFDDED